MITGTPETGQAYGSRAKQALSDLASGRSARIVVEDTDRYGKVMGRVDAGPMEVNAEMVRRAQRGCSAGTATTPTCCCA
jgi:endonuclease YncB( thermonuclease family)